MLTAVMLPASLIATTSATEYHKIIALQNQLAKLETGVGGRLGVFALDTGSGMVVGHRANERFPLCSTFKIMLAAAILARSANDDLLLQRRIRYTQSDIIAYSPISEQHLDNGMTIAELCAATVQHSDNTAANLLIDLLDGPAAVTAYARSIGNTTFRLDRMEPEMSASVPGDERDTVTPAAMAHSLRSLTLGNALPAAQRKLFVEWLCGSVTGGRRIRAAIPAGWQVGDKTGTGHYGTANDIGVIWPPKRAPLVLAIYHTQNAPDALQRDDVIVSATTLILNGFGNYRITENKHTSLL